MLKNGFRRLLSCVVAIILVLGNCMTVHAASTNHSSEAKAATIYDDGETLVKGYEDGSGNMVFTQYVRGKLVQRNTISANNPQIIRREFFDNTTTRAASSDTININDFGALRKSTATIQANSTRTLAGTINYRAPIDTGYVYYGLRCNYNTKEVGATTYTINGFVGTLVDLASIVAGAINIPISIATAYLGSLLSGLGIAVVGGVIKAAVTDTVSCNQTDYTWTLTDTKDSSHSKNVYGSKYYITDTKSAAVNKTYYEGYTPKDWGTSVMATWFHNEMYSYSIWEVVSWS